jgi:hypothetical protein
LEGIMKKVMMSYKVKREGIKATEGKFSPRILEKIEGCEG